MSNYQMQTVPQIIAVYQDEELNRQVARLSETTLALAEHTALQNQLYTALTKQVMNNTAALAASEDYFNQIAPSGREEYRLIVQAYARLAMKAVWTGGELR